MAILILDSLYKDIRQDSRYRTTYLVSDTASKKIYRDNWGIVNIPSFPDDMYHVVNSGEKNRIDLVAYKFYKNVRLWWIIALANNLFCPLFIEPGETLRIPQLNRIYQDIITK